MNVKYFTLDSSKNRFVSSNMANLSVTNYKCFSAHKHKRLNSQKSLRKSIQTYDNNNIMTKRTNQKRIFTKNNMLGIFMSNGLTKSKPIQQISDKQPNKHKKAIQIIVKHSKNNIQAFKKESEKFHLSFYNEANLEKKLIIEQIQNEQFSQNITQGKQFNSAKLVICNEQPICRSKIIQRQKIIRKISYDHTNSNFNISNTNDIDKRIKSSNKKKLKQSLIIQKNTNKPLFYFNQKQLSIIKAQSFIIAQYPSGQIITGNYFRKNGQIASLTKIMTFYCIYRICSQSNIDINEQNIMVNEQAEAMTGTSAFLCAGDVYTIKDLLFGLMLPSGNDAATALANWGGNLVKDQKEQTSIKNFINYMNKCAIQINMKNSRFGNPHGLPHNLSGSNPYQLIILIHKCLDLPFFRQVVKTKIYKKQIYNKKQNTKREVCWQNTNKLLRRAGFIGVKTGVTISAGPCLATCYELKGKIYTIVLLRTTKLSKRFKETRYILGMALNKLRNICVLFKRQIEHILRDDLELDSDNSQDEQQFNYERKDAQQMAKRNKILTFEM